MKTDKDPSLDQGTFQQSLLNKRTPPDEPPPEDVDEDPEDDPGEDPGEDPDVDEDLEDPDEYLEDGEDPPDDPDEDPPEGSTEKKSAVEIENEHLKARVEAMQNQMEDLAAGRPAPEDEPDDEPKPPSDPIETLVKSIELKDNVPSFVSDDELNKILTGDAKGLNIVISKAIAFGMSQAEERVLRKTTGLVATQLDQQMAVRDIYRRFFEKNPHLQGVPNVVRRLADQVTDEWQRKGKAFSPDQVLKEVADKLGYMKPPEEPKGPPKPKQKSKPRRGTQPPPRTKRERPPDNPAVSPQAKLQQELLSGGRK